jgi:hypothetical protein
MDQFDDNEIGRLLRLKKFEQPPPGYFENFLHEFHRRQRDELLRQPLWSVFWQRLSGSFFRLNIPSLTSYPAAVTAALICAAVVSLKIYQAPQADKIVDNTPVEIPAPNDAALVQLTLNQPMKVAINSPAQDRSRQMDESAHTHRAMTPPRYVLDRLPVSYEPSFNF